MSAEEDSFRWSFEGQLVMHHDDPTHVHEPVATGKKPAKKCNFCDCTLNLELHHIIPRSLGGTDDDFNLLTVCNEHHAILHSMKARGTISALTKQGLERAKQKGVRLGGSKAGSEAGKLGCAAQRTKADEFALKMAPSLNRMRSAGMTFQQIADELNMNGTKTVRGGEWYATTVRNIFERLPTTPN